MKAWLVGGIVSLVLGAIAWEFASGGNIIPSTSGTFTCERCSPILTLETRPPSRPVVDVVDLRELFDHLDMIEVADPSMSPQIEIGGRTSGNERVILTQESLDLRPMPLATQPTIPAAIEFDDAK